MEFHEFKAKFQAQFAQMAQEQDTLFVTAVDREALWETYLSSFPPGTNEIFRERREFDCSCCKQFVRTYAVAAA